MSTPDAAHDGYQLWLYYPSVPAGISVAAIFGILAAAHGVFLARKRTWFCIPLVIGGLRMYQCKSYICGLILIFLQQSRQQDTEPE
jgi:hypothetical protein